MKKYQCIFCFSLLLLFAGCAATYNAPQAKQRNHSYNVNASKDQIFNTVISIISQEGYTITYTDRELGIINTDKRRKNLTEYDCDCGTTMGIPYIKDKRTVTDVSLNFSISENYFEIRTAIFGHYLPNDPVYGKNFECISLGRIEEDLYSKISSRLK